MSKPAEISAEPATRPVAKHFDVAVIGAGLSGLTAARELDRAGKSVVVIEARDRVGGRTLNHDLGDGRVTEAGGQFVGPTQVQVLALADELGVQTFPGYQPGDQVLVKGAKSKRFRGDVPPDYSSLPGLAVAMARINRLSRSVPLTAPWQAPHAAKWDAITLETWLRRTAPGSGALDWVNVFLSSAYGGEASDASLLFTLWYVAMFGDAQHVGTIDRGIAGKGGAQDARLRGGSQQLSIRIAEQLGDRVVLNAPVRRVDQDLPNNGASVGRVRVHADSQTFTADRVIVAIPPQLASEIAWHPALPIEQDALLRRLPFGTLMKCEAIYDKPFWRSDGLSGMAVLRDGTPIRSMFDNTPPEGEPGVLMGFLGGREWRRWAPVQAGARRRAVLHCFARAFGPQAYDPKDYFEQDWTAERWTRGGPTAVAGPGTLTGFGRHLTTPFGAVHWAGAETGEYWNGFLEGAVRAGRRAAQEILEAT